MDEPIASERARAVRWSWLALVVAGLTLVVTTVPDLWRAGYSPDEEFTVFAVRGIEAQGLPLLPSGLLYDRGLAYSYASWGAGLAGGQSLPTFRVVSVAFGLAALIVLFRELRRITAPAVAAFAVILTAVSLPFWVSATTARFYTPFLLGYLVVLAVLARPTLSWRGVGTLMLAAAFTRWTHELAFTLGAVPLVAAVLSPRGQRREWTMRCVWVCAGLLAGQAAILAVHAAAPPSNGDVMIRRFFVWQVLNLFERPPMDLAGHLPAAVLSGSLASVALALLRRNAGAWSAALIFVGGVAVAFGQLALAPVAALIALPVAGLAVRRQLVGTGLAVAVGATAFWTLALTVTGQAPFGALALVMASGFRYPLDMLAYLSQASPILMAATLALLLARSVGHGGPWRVHERALHVLWIGWVLWFGVIASGITARYLLLPTTFMIAAMTLDACAIAARLRRGRVLALAAVSVLAVAVTFESWRGPLGGERRGAAARPTLVADAIRDEILPGDLVACTDELACVLVAGRADAWLALDDFFRERFIVVRGGAPTGTYTGAPASFELSPLLERATREGRRLVVLDVLKEVPAFGDIGILVPRQLAREQLRADVIVDVDGARLLHIVRPPVEGVARLSP